jgi:hypothetical protein
LHVCLSAKTLILILSLSLGILAFWAPKVEAASAPQGSLFQTLPIYLKSTASSIPGYYTVSVAPPSGSTIHKITLTSSGMFSQWISNAYSFPGGSITIDRFYCFLFSMYANGTAFEAGTMFGQFCIYRGGSEIFLFNTTESEYIRNSTASRHQWYYRTQQNITFLSGDRIVFKLFLNMAASGSFTFYYDSISHRSYLTDPTETRYLLNVANPDGTKQLSLDFPYSTYGAQSFGLAHNEANASWGIRVWNVTSGGVETEITAGAPVALVNRTANGGYSAQSNTWVCPAANWNQASNCSLRVKWYAGFNITGNGSGGIWGFLINSTTPGLGSNFLNSSTWTIIYYTKLTGLTTTSCIASLAYDGLEESANFYPTKIANIVYVSSDYDAPYFYNLQVTTTLASAANTLYCNWTEIGSVKSTLSKYRYGNNNSGTLTYITWIIFSPGETSDNVSAVFTNNPTPGNVIEYRWEANDTAGNLNDTMIFQYFTITSSVSWQNPIVWSCWFYRNWSTAITWLDDLILTIIIVPGWQPPIVWQFKIGINPNELAQAGVIALIFFPILLLLIVLLLRRKR